MQMMMHQTGFTDEGTNTYTDYPHAYLSENKLYLDYTDAATASVEVSKNTRQYSGIQHPDGMYGGEKLTDGMRFWRNSRYSWMRMKTDMGTPGQYRM